MRQNYMLLCAGGKKKILAPKNKSKGWWIHFQVLLGK